MTKSSLKIFLREIIWVIIHSPSSAQRTLLILGRTRSMAYVAAATECLLEIFLIPDIFNFPLDETFPLGFSPASLPIKFIQPGIYPFMNFLAAASLGPEVGPWTPLWGTGPRGEEFITGRNPDG